MSISHRLTSATCIAAFGFFAFTVPLASNAVAQQIDVAFVVDQSSQMTAGDFAVEKDWVSSTASQVLGTGDIWAALVGFSTVGQVSANLTGNLLVFNNAVTSLGQVGGASCLACGLSSARNHLLAVGRSGTCKAIVVLTDGNADAPAPDPAAAAQAEADQILGAAMDLYTIGVGADRDAVFLSSLARGAGTYSAVESAGAAWLDALIANCQATPTLPQTWSRLKLIYR